MHQERRLSEPAETPKSRSLCAWQCNSSKKLHDPRPLISVNSFPDESSGEVAVNMAILRLTANEQLPQILQHPNVLNPGNKVVLEVEVSSMLIRTWKQEKPKVMSHRHWIPISMSYCPFSVLSANLEIYTALESINLLTSQAFFSETPSINAMREQCTLSIFLSLKLICVSR
eukprot:751856-Hanusia_phi.AAC.4